jgi:hypothetical protein
MWNRDAARARGLITHCEASLIEPVTMSGQYKCTEGHAHSVQWMQGHPRVSQTGYDWAFLGALDDADEAGILVDSPETPAYSAAYRTIMTARGYADVL